MKNRIWRTAAGAFAAIVALSATSCKENTIINSNLAPAVDNIKTFALDPNDISCLSKTVYDDSIVTSLNTSPVIAGLGTVNADPFFGVTNAGIYFNVIPPTSSYTFPVSRSSIDSVVLVLPYNFTWGDTNNTNRPQKFSVYRMTDTFSSTGYYYSFSRFGVDRSHLLGTVTTNINDLKNYVQLKDSSVTPHMRIKITDNDFIQKLMDSSSQYADYPTFLSWFKGLYVEPDTTSSATGTSLAYFELDGDSYYNTAGLLFYMQDSVVSQFGYNTTNCAHSTWVKRNYTGYPVAPYYSPSRTDDSIIMIQNEPGAAADIRITNIRHIDSVIGKSLINKAQILITKVDVGSSSIYTEPSRIRVTGIDDYGTYYFIADNYVGSSTSSTFIDGVAQSVTVGAFTVTQYSINFPRELQKALIQGRTNLHLLLNGTQTYPGAYRLIAGGKSNSNATYKLQINVIYSKID
ncbi:hypothetical protein [Taibaiella soli]|uniref:DUF4270 domain-containing protein n=1 Tax=Taibaiella soli TaxID=1649169 RepID=A0A2W2AVM2_9BACT|nr:hypothetical protein [Taibaiella soli]PZF72014.1 hypothetical protein DN068_15375 [Taibaiella soli]